jgi:hypothetical protein
MTGISSNDISRVPRPAHPRHLSESNLAQHLYPPQLCIFVIFEKKAGIIRIADSAVGEIELFSGTDKDTMGLPQSSSSKESMSRLSPNPNTSISGSFVNRHRSHSVGNARRDKGNWIHPTQIEVPPPPSANDHLPTPGSPGSTPVYLLTRGRTTHVLPYPLPAVIDAKPPLYVITWTASPSHVAVRLNHTSYELGAMPFIQLIAFTEDGLEIQEFDRETITGHASGKGKARVTEPIRAQADVGGEVGFLCEGGHWQRAQNTRLARAFSVSSDASGTSFESLDSVQADAKLAMEQVSPSELCCCIAHVDFVCRVSMAGCAKVWKIGGCSGLAELVKRTWTTRRELLSPSRDRLDARVRVAQKESNNYMELRYVICTAHDDL